MHPIRRDSIPSQSAAPPAHRWLEDFGNRHNNKDYGGIITRFMHSDAMVWEIAYNRGTHYPYTIASAFAQAIKRLGYDKTTLIVTCRGALVFLAKPGWENAARAVRASHAQGTPADRARVRMMVTGELIDFAESDDTERIVTIPGDQTALYHALHYQRGRLALSITIARDGERIVLRRRG
jgi:hypothetical protein